MRQMSERSHSYLLLVIGFRQKKITGVDKIYAVVGGLHFQDAGEEKIAKSIEALQEVQWVFAGHCTGFEGMCRIAGVKGDRFKAIPNGTEIRLCGQGGDPQVTTIPTAQRDRHRTINE